MTNIKKTLGIFLFLILFLVISCLPAFAYRRGSSWNEGTLFMDKNQIAGDPTTGIYFDPDQDGTTEVTMDASGNLNIGVGHIYATGTGRDNPAVLISLDAIPPIVPTLVFGIEASGVPDYAGTGMWYDASTGTVDWKIDTPTDDGYSFLRFLFSAGTSSGNVDILSILNNSVGGNNTGTSILFQQADDNASLHDSGKITVGTEQAWSYTDVSTMDTYMAFSTDENDSVSQKVKITSDGDVKILEGGIYIGSGASDPGDENLYIEGDITVEGDSTLQGALNISGFNGNVLWVGPNSTYTTIQGAIDVASAGDTILVAPGTYTEDVVVDLANLALIALGKVTIVGTVSLYSGSLLDGFTIVDTTTIDTYGIISIGNDTGVIVRNCSVTGTQNANKALYGICTGSYSSVLIENTDVTLTGNNTNTGYIIGVNPTGTTIYRGGIISVNPHKTSSPAYGFYIQSNIGTFNDLDIQVVGASDTSGEVFGFFCQPASGTAINTLMNSRVTLSGVHTGSSYGINANTYSQLINANNVVIKVTSSGTANYALAASTNDSIINGRGLIVEKGVYTGPALAIQGNVGGVLATNLDSVIMAGEALSFLSQATATDPVLCLEWYTPITTEDDLSFKAHDATYRGTMTLSDQFQKSRAWMLDFDGVDDYVDIADNNDFSFNDAGAEGLTIIVWGDIIAGATTQTLVAKWDETTGAEKREWKFELTDAEKMKFTIYDESANVECSSLENGAIGEGYIYCMGVTYDGSGGATAGNGIIFYQNGAADTAVATNDGSYMAMENLTSKLYIGAQKGASATGNFYTGNMGQVLIIRKVLTPAQMYYIYKMINGYYKSVGGQWS